MIHNEQFTGDDWRCRCGNTPMSSGFQPCQTDGRIVEPTLANWPESLYRCCECGVIIEHDDECDRGEIVGQAVAGVFDDT